MRHGAIVRLVAVLLAAFSFDSVTAGAQSANGPSSLLVFPRIEVSDSRDTLIQISNLTQSTVRARCFYVDGTTPAVGVPASCGVSEFQIDLTASQPTHWLASTGRNIDFDDAACSAENSECAGAGIDPGVILPLTPPFRGELICVVVEPSGGPAPGDALLGTSTVREFESRSVIKHRALGFSVSANDGDSTLCLGGTERSGCPQGAELTGCAETWVLPHIAENAADPAAPATTASTSVTIVPCRQDLANGSGGSTTVSFSVANEFEETFSASTTVNCWGRFALRDVNPAFQREVIGSDTVSTRMRAPSSSSGFLVVADTVRRFPAGEVVDGHDLFTIGEHAAGDSLILPALAAPAPLESARRLRR